MAEKGNDVVNSPIRYVEITNVVILHSQFSWGKLDVPGYAVSDAVLQFKKLTYTFDIITPTINGIQQKLHRVVFDLGVRLIGSQFIDTPADSIDETMVVAEVLANIAVDYHAEEGELDQAWFEDFVRKNSVIHFWPFWREYVHNAGFRAGLPAITLPLFKPDLIPLESE